MYTHILSAVDLSNESLDVMVKSKQLAESLGAKLTVLNVVEPIFPVHTYEGELAEQLMISTEQLNDNAQKMLTSLADKAGIDHGVLVFDGGAAVDTVLDVAKEKGCDLICVGSHGKSGLKLLLGSVTNGILHHTGIDVLAIRVKEAD